jgi:hypothetical protein
MDDIEINLDTTKPASPKLGHQAIGPQSIPGKIENDTLASDGLFSQFDFRRSSHPIACLFHILLKGLALFFYMFMGTIFDDVVIFLTVTILLAFDFWTVKNVTGRLLVGLRWWTTIDENGKEQWFFESYDHKVKNSPVDSTIFWWSQMGATGSWAFFFFWRLLTIFHMGLFWLGLSFLGFFFSGLNLYGYFKCSKDYNQKLKGAVTNISSKLVTSSLMAKYGMGLFGN